MKAMRQKKKSTKNVQKTLPSADQKLPFLEHIYELKRRLFYVAVSIFVFGSAAYGVQQHIVNFLLRPTKGQSLIYTSPGGGLDFLVRICLYTGVIFSLPIIVYQVLKYIEPLLGHDHVRYALMGSAISAVLAAAGMAFGYYAGMPATLHFLFHQFTTSQIHPMITVQAYMSFVTMYMFGAALLFQVPLLMIFINRIKPLKPSKLLKYERWMILASFVLAIIMNPTPNIIDQLMLAGPMILTYQVGIVIIAVINRSRRGPKPSKRPKKIIELLERDDALRAERELRLAGARVTWKESIAAIKPVHAIPALPQAESRAVPVYHTPRRPPAGRSQKYVDGFVDYRRSSHPGLASFQNSDLQPVYVLDT